MANRQSIVAGNWKMNTVYEEGKDLASALVAGLQPSNAVVILGVPFTHLRAVSHCIADIRNLHLAAQNCHAADAGAYTGEISVPMLKAVGCDYVILGHSERRAYFGDTNEVIAAKVKQALKHGLRPIFCCGEELPIREAGEHEALVAEQISAGLFGLSAEEFAQVVIAYEPVWAIGTGVTASPAQAQEMHAFIRQHVAKQYGEEAADATSILYGGSVKPANAEELFQQTDVDGGLVGGASLKAESFLQIIAKI